MVPPILHLPKVAGQPKIGELAKLPDTAMRRFFFLWVKDQRNDEPQNSAKIRPSLACHLACLASASGAAISPGDVARLFDVTVLPAGEALVALDVSQLGADFVAQLPCLAPKDALQRRGWGERSIATIKTRVELSQNSCGRFLHSLHGFG